MATNDNSIGNHGYNLPQEGQANWHEPLNENFRQIDRDIEIRDLERNRDEYEATGGAKFVSTDTGRTYVGDGSSWQLLQPAGTAGTPSITCYESDGTSYAETASRTFTGACIFDAAQQAIDAQIEAENGDIEVVIKQGEYDLTTGIVIDADGLERVYMGTPDWNQVKLNTARITDQSFVVEVDPGPIQDGEYSRRGQKISINGFELDDSGRSGRAIGGIYVNDYESLKLTNHSIYGGFKRALWLRNIWQGKVDTVEIFEAGVESESLPAIQVGHREDVDTHQAINHIQFNHLQGGPRTQYAYFEARGKATRLDIEYPNAELAGNRGFVFDGADSQMTAQVRGAQLTDGAPAVEIKDGAQVQIFGGQMSGEPTAIAASGGGVPKVIIGGGLRLGGGSGGPTVSLRNSWVNMSNFHVAFGSQGILADNCGMVNVSNGTIRDSAQAGLKLTNASSRTYNVSNLNLLFVAGDGESPVVLDSVANLVVSNIAAHSERSGPAVDIISGNNVDVSGIVPAGSLSEPYATDSGSSMRTSKGTATVSSGSRAVTVGHSLSSAPEPADVSVTPHSALGQASSFHVANRGSETFDIVLDANPGQNVQFGWHASL